MTAAIRLQDWASGWFRPLAQNPVVTRDLRVQLRGTRAYVQIAIYLFLLGLLAIAGYSQAAGEGTSSVVQVQQKLQGFYNFIFYTLAALIALIAPALTASSITSEKQRQTLDLLLTTPLSAMELLLGKLMSSIAFIALLLFLSLPASALCVLLGGATLWDVFQVYLFFAIDGLLFAAIGLYYSCTARNSLEALSWTYFSLILFFFCTSFFALTIFNPTSFSGSGPAGSGNPLFALGALNPFVGVAIAGRSFSLLNVNIPTFLGSAFVAFLLIRLLITSATLKMGRYGAMMMPALRRQILYLTFLIVCVLFYVLSGIGFFFTAVNPAAAMVILLALGSGFFLPALFAPALPEDAELGTIITGAYQPKKMFVAQHAGALPFFHLWVVTFVGAALLGIFANSWISGVGLAALGATPTSTPIGPGSGASVSSSAAPLTLQNALLYFALAAFYLSGLGFLMWCIARRAATAVVGGSAVRALTFGGTLFVIAFPQMIRATLGQRGDDTILQFLYLLYPLLQLFQTMSGNPGLGDVFSLFLYGCIAYLIGILIYLPWKSVTPATTKFVLKPRVAAVAGTSAAAMTVPMETSAATNTLNALLTDTIRQREQDSRTNADPNAPQ